MSGGIGSAYNSSHGCNSRLRTLENTDDQNVAWFDLDAAVRAMPFKVVSTLDLRALNIFQDSFPEDSIGVKFHITYLGIRRAIEDAEDTVRCENEENLSYDAILLRELARRAAIFLGIKKVEYVEDMVPVIGQGDEGFDELYWSMVRSQASFWEGLSVATKEAITVGNTNAANDEMVRSIEWDSPW